MIQKAKLFAITAHGDQTYTEDVPYWKHLEQVAQIVQPFGDRAVIVAWLHDVLEDTDVTEEDLITFFGVDITEDVKLLTDDASLPNRKSRKIDVHSRFSKASDARRISFIVKAADRLANVRSSLLYRKDLLEMYRKEHEEFRRATHKEGLCPQIWEELDETIRSER